jgi:hypothetical protein
LGLVSSAGVAAATTWARISSAGLAAGALGTAAGDRRLGVMSLLMVYSFYPGTPADRTGDWRSKLADQCGGIVVMIRQGGAQLEGFCQKSGNFLPICVLQGFWAYQNTNFIEF